jgi:hypothetical protein
MALNYDLSKIENYEELLEDGKLKQPYAAIVLSTVIVALSDITNENFDKFYNRINVLERLNGPFLFQDKNPYYISKNDVKRMIGLNTNVSNETKAKFFNRVKRNLPENI